MIAPQPCLTSRLLYAKDTLRTASEHVGAKDLLLSGRTDMVHITSYIASIPCFVKLG